MQLSPAVPNDSYDPLWRNRERWWKNDEYTVIEVFRVPKGEAPEGWTHLSIRRNDREPIHDWRDLYAIKCAVCGPEREAIEIYPAWSRCVDAANQFHLWVLPEGQQIGVGFTYQAVTDSPPTEVGGVDMSKARQRPFEEAPA